MSSNRPSRWIAPLALLAALGAVLFVISGSTQDSESGSESAAPSEERAETTGSTDEEREAGETTASTSTTSQRKTYRVRPGDTLGVISERTGVSVEELQELNPDIDANSLTVGEKIKLTE